MSHGVESGRLSRARTLKEVYKEWFKFTFTRIMDVGQGTFRPEAWKQTIHVAYQDGPQSISPEIEKVVRKEGLEVVHRSRAPLGNYAHSSIWQDLGRVIIAGQLEKLIWPTIVAPSYVEF